MRTATSFPYKRAAQHRMTAGQWDILSAEHSLPLPPILSELDYSSMLSLRREVVIDVESIRTECGLPRDAHLLAVASWSSTGTMLRRVLARAALPVDDDVCLVELSGEIACGDIADFLHIDTAVLLAQGQGEGNPLVARRAGAILLHERQSIRLDSSQSFFPVEVVDFGKGCWANSDAGWHLSWNVFFLDQPFLGSVRLLVNAAHPRVVQAVSGMGEAPNAEASAIRSVIYFDVARSLILGALASEEFVERNGDYGVGTCGKIVSVMIHMLFPGDGISGLAAAAKYRPDHFSTDLQGRLRIFWS